ncbi:MAG: hypothetical protein AAGA48_38195 [Myxococcota bacterium]
MGEMIRKPDANPILLGIANLFVFGSLGYFLMGQSQKGVAALVYTVLLGCCLGPIPALIFAYDGYLLGQKLESGESIGDKENGLDFLDNLPGFN